MSLNAVRVCFALLMCNLSSIQHQVPVLVAR
jgi:hypothetical protein